ncbi:MAG: PadR family transcriptional regulator [Acidimicrobiales bacterium]|nr:PadR family transcriptional regulator [Acidimicrobiales bacterium]
MVDLAILGLLRGQDLHGYELKKQINELLGARSKVSFGSLYPALARLERSGFVEVTDDLGRDTTQTGSNTPASGSLTGEIAAFRQRLSLNNRSRSHRDRRGRKVYAITARGQQHLHDLLARTDGDDRTFALRVAFCRYLKPEERLELFEHRRAELAASLTAYRRRGLGSRFDNYLRSLADHDTRSLANDLAWVDELIAQTRLEMEREDAGSAPSPLSPAPSNTAAPSLDLLGAARPTGGSQQ